jgi:hypothetical protein
MSDPVGTSLRQSKALSSLWWCLPSIVGFLVFLCAFPIDRRIPIWPHLSLIDLFGLWFIFIAPITTAIALVVFLRHMRTGHQSQIDRFLVLAVISISVLVNAFVLFGLCAGLTF